MRKATIINIGLLAGSLIGFLLVIEFGLRITGLQTVKPNPPKIYQQSENPEISYELIPNVRDEPAYKATVSTDEKGFRINGKRKTENGKQTIVILGDSIAFGHGVYNEQTLSAQLEKNVLNFPLSTFRFQFLNAAVPGYQLRQQTATYKEKIQDLDPSGVMLVFYWNDINAGPAGILDDEGILREHNWVASEKVCQPIETGILGLIPGKCWLDTHSAFYKAFKKLMNLKASTKVKEQERSVLSEENDDAVLEGLIAYGNDLQKLANDLPRNRTFVIWPDNFLHTEARKQLTSIAQQNGFTVIDLYEYFGNQVETLVWDTVHPSPKSIEEAAKYILQKLYSL